MLIPIGDIAPRSRTPVINYLLIGANVLVFLLYAMRPQPEYQEIVISYGLTPSQFEWQDMLTSMFLHAGIFHLFGNMLFLWITGDNVEDRFHHLPFFLFYLAGGAAAAGTQMFMSTAKMAEIPMIGASGAVSAVIGAYLILFPGSRIKLLFWFFIIVHVFRVRSWTVILLWIGLESLHAWQETQGALESTVAVWAHLGGFAFGVAAAILWKLFSPFRNRWQTENSGRR